MNALEAAYATLESYGDRVNAAHARYLAIRRLAIKAVRTALAQTECAACDASIPALTAEVETAFRALNTPTARLIVRGAARPLLFALEALEMPSSVAVARLESNGRDQFFCGGGMNSGKVHVVRQPKRNAASQ